MKHRLFITTLIASAIAFPALTSAQPGPGAGRGAMQQQFTRERLFGSPLMTLEERQEHQRQMWNAKTVQERQKIRDENRTKMLARAQQQNYKIDEKQDDYFSVPGFPSAGRE